MTPNNSTSLNLVVGYPLEHTQSPLLHNNTYKQLKLNAVLLPFENSNIREVVKVIKLLRIGLTAITMPHKERIIKYLDYCSPEASLLKAVNTVIQIKHKLYGYNTDVYGIEYALRKISLKNKSILITGAGGAAKAASYVVKKNGGNLYIFNRTPSRAIKLAKTFEATAVNDIRDLNIDIIINATPIGMKHCDNLTQHPTSLLLNYLFNKNQVVFDMIYNPRQTALLKRAKKMGAKIISGIDMFNAQGMRQIELWLESTKDLLS